VISDSGKTLGELGLDGQALTVEIKWRADDALSLSLSLCEEREREREREKMALMVESKWRADHLLSFVESKSRADEALVHLKWAPDLEM
jgi:hypothetical protein